MTGRKLIIKNHHGGLCKFHQHLHFLGLALTNEGVGIRGVAVLQHLAGAEAAGGFQKCFQFLQGLVCGGLILPEGVGVQAHQNRPFLNVFIKTQFHNSSIGSGK